MRWRGWKLFNKYVIASPDGGDYLIRWQILETPQFGIFLHKILRGDEDRALHNHPWTFISVILKGGYFEEFRGGGRDGKHVLDWKGPGSVLFRSTRDLHRVTLKNNQPTWTLILVGPRVCDWGFQTGEGWVSHEDYIAARYHDPAGAEKG